MPSLPRPSQPRSDSKSTSGRRSKLRLERLEDRDVPAPLVLTSTSPTPNSLSAPSNTDILAVFDQTLNPATVTDQTLFVHGQQSGRLLSANDDGFSASGQTATVNPSGSFFPGELVQVTVTAGIQNGGGDGALPRVREFRVAATGGTGRFKDSGQNLGTASSFTTALGDLDGDGDLDLVVGAYGATRVWVNNGSGVFTDSGQALGTGDTRSVALGDLDGDGDLDFVQGNANSDPNQVWLNNGSGVFTDSGQSLGASNTLGVALGDLDGDGDLDFVQGNSGSLANRVWLNNGSGTFTNSGQALGNNDTRAVALGDLDGDGDLDLVEGNGGTQADRVWVNDGSGTFTDSGQTLGNTDTRAVALGDLDGDGDLDLVAGVAYGSSRVWVNDGAGTFTNSGQALNGTNTRGLALGDVNGDGGLDLAQANRTGSNKVWTNYALVVSPTSLAPAIDSVAYSTAVTATGGTGTVSFAVTAGALPAGLILASDGTLSGTPTEAGSFTFTVTATDSSANPGPYTGTREYTLTVHPTPTIAISGSGSVNEGAAYTLNLGAITAPGGGTVTSWVVHWGDGNTIAYPTGGDVTHTYDDGPATWDVTVDLVDDNGTFPNAANAHSVTVANVSPTANFASGAAVNEGTAGTVTFSLSYDPSTADTTAGFRYAFDFDADGSIDVGSLTYASASTSATVNVPATDNPGRVVKGYVIDKDGAATSYVATITVNNVAPTAGSVSGPATVRVGTAGVYSLTGVSDPSTTDTTGSQPLRYSFSLSPGGLAANYAAASAANTFTRTPTSTGAFTVYARVYDKDGGVSQTYSLPVTAIAGGLKFDMKTATGNLPGADWSRVRGGTLYSAATGYGWATTVKEADKATNYPAGATTAERDLYRDYNYGGGAAAFSVYVGANRSASVKVYSYPASAMSLGMTVSATNGTTARLTTDAPYLTVTGTAGADGVLTLNFRGGIFGLWLVNGVEVTLT